ncbi:MAG: leucine-rich repeat protein, partial [Clostridia bacterium]|nr:leucine-rich repeat protein [Clostridia bacterium]
SVGNYAFNGCRSLKALEFPDSVTSYGMYMIRGCVNLERLVIGGGCATLKSQSYTYSYYNTSRYKHCTTFYIGEGSKLNYLEIREGVTAIDHLVFANEDQESTDWNASSMTANDSWYGFPNLATVILPESLISIGNCAFYKAGIKNLTIKGDIVSWGTNVFAGSTIETLSVYGNVGNYAFNNCRNLKEVNITGEGYIGQCAFQNCISLETVTIGNGLKSVGKYAFNGCRSLKALEFPDSVTSYGMYMIKGCVDLELLVIGGGCAALKSEALKGDNNYTYYYCTTFYVGEGSKLNYLEIREGVTSIDNYLFANENAANENFSSNAWYGFTNLTTLKLPESLVSIGKYAFYKAGNASGHLTLHINGSIATWGNQAFSQSGIQHLSVNGSVGASAFANCMSLLDVHISGTGTIGASAFSGCTSLMAAVIDEGVTSVGASAFANCRSLTELAFPDSVTSYGANMISGCTGLKNLTIGGGCANLSYAPFYIGAGSSLESLRINEGVTSLGDYTLANASSASNVKKHEVLTSLVLPESLETIGANNINMLPALVQLIGGSHVTSIGSGTAVSAGGLTIYTTESNDCLNGIADANVGVAIHSDGSLPVFSLSVYTVCSDEVTEIETRELAVLQALNLPDIQTGGWMMAGWYTDTACTKPLADTVMPARDLAVYAKLAPMVSVTWLADAGDPEAESADYPGWYVVLTELVPEGSRVIPPTAAYEGRDFVGWYSDDALTERWSRLGFIVPEEGVTVFGHYAPLYDAEFILVYPDGHTAPFTTLSFGAGKAIVPPEPSVDGYSLAGWYREETLDHVFKDGWMTESGLTLYAHLVRVTAGGIYRETEDGLALVSYIPEEDEGTEIYLPAKVNGIPVVSIDAEAFKGTDITLISLPEGLLDVDEHAFDGAEALSILRISSANSAFAVKDGVLYSKDMTKLVRYPEGKSTVDFAIPASVATIREGALRGARRMRTVTIPDGITAIPREAFSGCESLAAVTLPDSVAELGEGAFYRCWSLTAFTAYGLMEIGENAIPAGSDVIVTGPVGEGALREYCLVETETYTYFAIPYNLCILTLNINGSAFTTLQCEKGMPANPVIIRALVEGFESIAAISSDASAILELEDGTIITGWYSDAARTVEWNLQTDILTGDKTLYAASIPQFSYEETDFVTGVAEDDEGNPVEITTHGVTLTGYYGKGGSVVLPDTIGSLPVMGIAQGAFNHANGLVTSIAIGAHVIEIADGAFDSADGSAFAGVILTEPESWAEGWAEQQAYEHGDHQYTLSFVTYGASMQPVQAACGVVVRVGTPVRTGGEFVGWYLDEALQTPADLENGTL